MSFKISMSFKNRHSADSRSSPSIRKVHAPSHNSDADESSLFPAGFKVDMTCRDPDELTERAVFWGLHHEQLGPGKFFGSLRGVHSARIQLAFAQRDRGLLIEGTIPAGSVVLGSICRQTAPFLLDGETVAENQLFKFTNCSEVEGRSIGGFDNISVAVSAQFFESAARAMLGPAFEADCGARRLALTSVDSRAALNRRLRGLLDEAYVHSELLQDPAQSQSWEHRVLTACLTDVAAPVANSSPSVRRLAARRAMDLLRSQPDRKVSIAELCQETNVAKRTLMLGFLEAFGLSPMVYHRQLRLNHARREILSGAVQGTVAAVAMRWGFYHLGRFSAAYRLQFGESPSATFRRCMAAKDY